MKRLIINFQKFVRKLFRKAEEYGVSPKVFIALYLFSFLPVYGGAYLMVKGSGITSIPFKDLLAFKLEGLQMNNETVISGFLINQAGWALPYLYVAVAGRRFKWYIRLAVLLWASLLLIWRVWKIFQ